MDKIQAQFSQAQIYQNIKSSFDWALAFAIDNNYTGVSAAVQNAFGLTTPFSSPAQFIEFVKVNMKTNPQVVINAITTTPYINEAPNWTGGFNEYFQKDGVANGNRSVWNSLLGALGAGLSTFSGLQSLGTQATGSGTGGGTNAAAAAAAAAAEEERKRKEAEEKRKKTMNIILYSAIGLVALILIVVLIKRMNKKS